MTERYDLRHDLLGALRASEARFAQATPDRELAVRLRARLRGLDVGSRGGVVVSWRRLFSVACAAAVLLMGVVGHALWSSQRGVRSHGDVEAPLERRRAPVAPQGGPASGSPRELLERGDRGRWSSAAGEPGRPELGRRNLAGELAREPGRRLPGASVSLAPGAPGQPALVSGEPWFSPRAVERRAETSFRGPTVSLPASDLPHPLTASSDRSGRASTSSIPGNPNMKLPSMSDPGTGDPAQGGDATCQDPDVLKKEADEACAQKKMIADKLTFFADGCENGTYRQADYGCIPAETPLSPPADLCIPQTLGDGATCVDDASWMDQVIAVCQNQWLSVGDVQPSYDPDCPNKGSRWLKFSCCKDGYDPATDPANDPGTNPAPTTDGCFSDALGDSSKCLAITDLHNQADAICSAKSFMVSDFNAPSDCPNGQASQAKYTCCPMK